MAEADRLIVTGFMGVGKSSVSDLLANILKIPRFDSDEEMERLGIDVPKLLRRDMSRFRILEAATLRRILRQQGSGVFSTGGGIVSTEVGRAVLLNSGAPVVWLQAPFEVSAARVAGDTGRERPLFANLENARKIYDERQKWYKQTATHIIDASQPVELVAGAVVSTLRQAAA